MRFITSKEKFKQEHLFHLAILSEITKIFKNKCFEINPRNKHMSEINSIYKDILVPALEKVSMGDSSYLYDEEKGILWESVDIPNFDKCLAINKYGIFFGNVLDNPMLFIGTNELLEVKETN